MNENLMSGYDIRGTREAGLTTEAAWNIGKALADWLPTTGGVIVVYGAGQTELAHALREGILLQGRSVVDGGPGDKDQARAYITAHGLSGGVVVGYDPMEQVATIELYQEEAKLIESETGLKDILEQAEAGNFVPAAVKGELTALA